ncbi:Septum-promoting GTP-binding protein 1 [Venturia nashicola]|uniref:adenosine deaminase n=1 Tax=Venturia nashicola TaxID=86259 RepID=A0A4Z1NYN0_9PEZI|nr:Septum-promoting GTP-binding protein 1 [Venturia nashicola]
MKRRFLRKRKKPSNPKMDKLGIPNGDTTMMDVGPNDVKLDSDETFLLSLKDVGAAAQKYDTKRQKLQQRELETSWDFPARLSASEDEKKAATIVWKIREDERDNLFGNKASEAIPGPETLDMGGQFLTNKTRIEASSRLFQIAKQQPKGCHLHLHFNAELTPNELMARARQAPNMFIRSTEPLVDGEPGTGKSPSYSTTELVFNVMADDTPAVNIFSPNYNSAFRPPGSKPWMRYRDFILEYEARHNKDGNDTAENFILSKMVLVEEEVYGNSQTTNGIWARFNQATRCFKGLLNYKSIFTWYIGQAIESMILDGVMYAELRPMLMDKSIPGDDGIEKVGHVQQMEIILEETKRKQDELRASGKFDKFPFGLKIIYCAPRSIPKSMMQTEIKDCIRLKLQFPDLLCGFDLVGAEDRANHIGYYRDELLAMVDTCNKLGIEIPFMFHAGETLLDTGGSKDVGKSNLFDAVLFNAKRIGHGYSLLKHPVIVEEFKKQNICIELCPTSNELLHLCRNVKEHPYPEILAMGIECTINSDNPSLFSNSVSHEFYQVMVGSPAMNIHGWRQLAEWSIKHSMLSAEEKLQAYGIFKMEWETFCKWIIKEYGAFAETLDIQE